MGVSMQFFRRVIGAVVLVVACTQSVAHAGDTKIVSDARDSAEWIAKALNSSGYKADFSISSLKEVDRFLEEQAPKGVPKPGGLLGEHLGSRVFSLGSYVGEVLIRNAGGNWKGDDSDPEAEINLAVQFRNGSQAWPIQRVMKRLRNGSEDSVFAYGVALSADAPK